MEQYWDKLAYQRRDLSTCASEPIQFCGAIQDFGWLLACDRESGLVAAASENCAELFEMPLESLLSMNIADLLILSDESPFCVQDAMDESKFGLRNLRIKSSGRVVEGTRCHSGRFIFFDLEEQHEDEHRDPVVFVNQLRRLVHNVDSETEIEPMLRRSVDRVREVTGFDRVMIYRFEPSWDGYVIAESLRSGLEPFLGLFYPASDIPPQARALYLESKFRMIVDVDSDPVGVRTAKGLGRSELDLGCSLLRAVSPFHIQYLRNMGVRSSFSVPLKVNGKLWGLISCHHYEKPIHLTRDIRSSCELAAQIISGRVSDQISDRRLRIRNDVLSLSQSILNSVTDGRTAIDAFRLHADQLLQVTASTGLYVRLAGDEMLIGTSPPPVQRVHQIINKLSTIESLGLWQSQDVATALSIPVEENSVGALAVPLSFGFEDLIVWFRPEFSRHVNWGGNPNLKNTSVDILNPRSSFKVWTEQVKGKSQEWDEASQESAQYILFTFVKGIFQKAADLSRTNRDLERVTQAKDEFIGMISHELRTPLGVMIGWIDILRDEGGKDPNFLQAIEIIDRNAKLQINLINDLLDVSRIISGKMRINPEADVELSKVIREVIHDLTPTARIKSIQLNLELPETLRVSVDPERMRQIVYNLVSNAIKFTPKQGEIEVGLQKIHSSYEIYVRDTGIGIPLDQMNRIFERFAQAREGHASMGGLGLGLSIVKALVELHGGSVRAASEGRDKGSTFTASFPVFNLAGDIDSPTAVGEAPMPDAKELEGLRVLIAEDQPDAAVALEYSLKKMGATTMIVNDGKSAFKKLAAEKFDLLLSDIGMPEWDGIELIRRVRMLERERQSLPVAAIALTAYATSKDRARCLEAGFQSHIAKPVDREELFAVIRSLEIKGGKID